MAADCIPITLERIRARIEIGNSYFVTTGTDPNAAGDIMSFSINKSRGQPIATFRCSLSVKFDSNALQDVKVTHDNLGQQIIVYAGVGENSDSNLPRLFTGYVTNLTQDPHWDDARKFILNISGEDEFAKMKYGGKFSRRFKGGEDAYATINSGKRREGGRMTKLKRTPAGRKGVDGPDTGSSDPGSSLSGGHSPLIRTPDPQGLSPDAAKLSSRGSTEPTFSQVRWEPSHVYASVGDIIFAKVVDGVTGEEIDPNSLKNTQGTKCLLCMTPPPSSFEAGSTGSSTAQGMDPDKKLFPVSVKYGSDVDPNSKGFTFTITGDYPAKVTFIHPLTAASCTINFHQIPPHNHQTMPQGGPAVGTYDVAQY